MPVNRYLPHLFALLFISTSLLAPSLFIDALKTFNAVFMSNFDWLILLASTGFVFLCVWLAFSRFGRLRLGSEDDRPEYSTLSWLAMLFAAGMGAGLMFWGTAEPLLHTLYPPPGSPYEAGSGGAARNAMVLTLLHWALHPWSIYAVAALTIAYFAFRKGQPFLPSAPMRGNREGSGWLTLMTLVDITALMAVVFGVVASLGAGVLQIAEGLNLTYGIGPNPLNLGIIMLLLFAVYMLSALGGVNRGIKFLSDLNMGLCILLMVFVLAAGPTVFILQTAVNSLGDYLSQFLSRSLTLRHYTSQAQWTHEWTLINFLWWIAWGPFVGVFIARISRGRTIREFICGVVLAPSVFSLLWFATLGGSGLHQILIAQEALDIMLPAEAARATYLLLATFPWSQAMQLLTVFLVFIFLITSADSGTYVLGMFSSHGKLRPPIMDRLFWGCVLGGFTVIALVTGEGILLMRSFAAAGAIPFMFIMLWQVACLVRSLRKEGV